MGKKSLCLIIIYFFSLVCIGIGCAGAKPKIYVSELPKTKFLHITVKTYKEVKKEENKLVFSQESNEEFGIIFKEALEKELKKNFVIFNSLKAAETPNDILFIEISAMEKPPPISVVTNGFVIYSVLVKYRNKIIWQLEALNITSSLFRASHVLKKITAPALAKIIIKDFK